MARVVVAFKSFFFRNWKITIGLSTFLFFVVIGLLASSLAPYHVMGIGQFPKNLLPSQEHFLGTDIWGRDIMDMLIVGVQNSLAVGILAGIIGTFIGVMLGILAGYKGGLVDHVIRTVTDGFLVIPTWPLLILLSAYLRGLTIPQLAFVLSAFSWPWSTRMMRAQSMSWKERGFINLARISGLGGIEIAFREIFPNMLPYIGVVFGNSVSGAMAAETGLEVLGIGPANVATLGRILQHSFYFGALARRMYWWFLPPVLILILIFMSLQLINMGLDEIYNPRLKKITGE